MSSVDFILFNNSVLGVQFCQNVEVLWIDHSTMIGCIWLVWHCLQGSGRSSQLGNFFANADTNYQGKEKMGGTYHTNSINSGITDIDPMDLSESMQEAMHRSNIEMRYVSSADFLVLASNVMQLSKEGLNLWLAAINRESDVAIVFVFLFFFPEEQFIIVFFPWSWQSLALLLWSLNLVSLFCFAASAAEFSRKEIPLYVMPTASLIKLDSPLTSFTDLQHVLFEEERSAYNQAILNNMK